MTPFASATGRPDPLPLNAGIGPMKAYHKAHGNITKEQKRHAVNESIRTHIERGNLPPDTELVSGSEEEETSEEEGSDDARDNDEDGDDEQSDAEDMRPSTSNFRVVVEASDSAISDSEVP